MRLLHHQYLNDFNADDASQILVHAGLGFIDNFIDNVAISGGVPAAEMVWRSCFNGIRWFWLTHTIDVNKMWEALLLACIARLPRLFHKDSGSIGIEVLRFVSNDPYLVVSAASLMKSNGLNLSVLKESLSGAEIDVPMVIREAESWCDSAGRPKRWDDEFLRNLGPAGQ